ncbi:SAM-dependent methyltransferase [Jeotgalibacillus haloalkalitolerans]|uniref:Class I SAM-dependent methyltransferase n=1 Tax=Jeotgalibacillus haloalkalitolerans TaxID=3104292 RepID=A0ABU5KHI8_9BACL|nr:class I SAM-dependent methyltransferase [Jeotgalibacillus sp. HH7-29]MDZ5710709.1 class I SAM-dependent methyltransferase [Jeotgalibacillus sp. HH7-29]
MEWIKDFYTKQYEWMNINDEDMLKAEEKRLQHIEQFAGKSARTILELGGGKGYFAVAAAKKGYDVTVIELAENAAAYTQQLAKAYGVSENITVIQGDFYETAITGQFDAVCYWDGFGIGTDADQQRLLKRIREWLKPDGTAFIDIYTPWFWAKAAGQRMELGSGIKRAYDFDAYNCRMLDAWWEQDHEEEKVVQSLRCYSPADLLLLLNGLDLEVIHCESGGAMDYEAWKYHEKVSLGDAMGYLAVLK